MKVLRKLMRLLVVPSCLLWVSACAFEVNVTSQRTALENQVMGSYAQLEDDLVLNSSVRGKPTKGIKEKALLAKQNQAFNKDDIDELKSKGILGESKQGLLQILTKNQGLASEVKAEDMKLAKILVDEENRDRRVIWSQTISTNESLTDDNLKEVQTTYAKMMRDKSDPGHWYEADSGKWQQAVAGEVDTKKVKTPSENAEPNAEPNDDSPQEN